VSWLKGEPISMGAYNHLMEELRLQTNQQTGFISVPAPGLWGWDTLPLVMFMEGLSDDMA
jgi:hypothetical protein